MENLEWKLNKKIDELYKNLTETEKDNMFNKHKKTTMQVFIFLSLIFIVVAVYFIISLQETGIYLSIFMFLFSLFLWGYFLYFFYSKKNIEKNKERVIRNILKTEAKRLLGNEKGLGGYKDFLIDKYINLYDASHLSSARLLVDTKHKQFIYAVGGKYSDIIKFKDVLSYEIYEDGNSVVKGSAGRALIGGAFFGVAGALVGSSGKREISNYCQSLKLLVRINNIDQPLLEISFISGKTEKGGFTYKNCLNSLQQICAYFEYMINNKPFEESAKTLNDSAEEKQTIQTKSKKEKLTELKELFDDGLITEEDYNKKKQDILDSE